MVFLGGRWVEVHKGYHYDKLILRTFLMKQNLSDCEEKILCFTITDKRHKMISGVGIKDFVKLRIFVWHYYLIIRYVNGK